MQVIPSTETPPARWLRGIALVVVATGLVFRASAPAALMVGVLFAFLVGNPLARWSHSVTKWLLQLCVVLLGFGMNLPTVLRLGFDGSLFATVTIGSTLLLGRWLGRRLALDSKTSLLLSAGTAICGGSAIAAVSAIIGASEAAIAVSIGTVFLLNAAALYVFPLVGHFLHLDQAQFGLWAGVAIHDLSSVVGAGLSYGPDALQMAIAVKLSRTLWIVPLSLGIAFRFSRRKKIEGAASPGWGSVMRSAPWFIVLFLLASLLNSYLPGVAGWSPLLSGFARRGMILVLFLIGTSLSLEALRAVGGRAVVSGLTLWIFISVGSLLAILSLHLKP